MQAERTLLQSDHEHEKKAASESASFFADGIIATASHAKEARRYNFEKPWGLVYLP